MKKLLLILSLTVLFITGSAVAVSADAITYDMEEAGYYVYVATPDGGLNMRYGPGTEYSLVTTDRIPDGVKLYIGYVSGNWGYTSYDGNEGWVALRQTTTTPPEAHELPEAKKEKPEDTDTEIREKEEDTEETEIAEGNQDNTELSPAETNENPDVQIVKKSMATQIILIAVIVCLVVVIAVLIAVIINKKSKNKSQ